ncbi:MAG: hypothetical protein U0176_25550 [Bacteroidia bacterium]
MNEILIQLGQTMATSYSWGHAAKQASAPFKSIQEAQSAPQLPGLDELRAGMAELLGKPGQGVSVIVKADELIDRFEAFDDLREYLIDLCVVGLLDELEEEDEDALESPEWAKIETAAGDRGSELLNLLIYIKDCKLAGAEPDLEDFLYGFLLADDEDYQDEMAIYEPIVKSQDLIEAPLKQMIQAGNNQRDNELRELFTPLMAFFRDQEPQPGKVTLGILESSALPEVHCALYRVLCEAMKAEI